MHTFAINVWLATCAFVRAWLPCKKITSLSPVLCLSYREGCADILASKMPPRCWRAKLFVLTSCASLLSVLPSLAACQTTLGHGYGA